ncbi:hypothetical protein OIU76_019610 [Salix suchowensis]|nr:hypothetical protein OIU76_019610 [Salix suchowensis]
MALIAAMFSGVLIVIWVGGGASERFSTMSTLTRPEPFSRPAARTSSSLSGSRNRQFHHYLKKRSLQETMKKPTKIKLKRKENSLQIGKSPDLVKDPQI